MSLFNVFESITQRVQSVNTVEIALATVIRVTMEEYVKNRVASVFVHQDLWELIVKQVGNDILSNLFHCSK